MGASTSRGISVRNPDPPGKVIQITEDVAKRITARYGQTPASEQKGETGKGTAHETRGATAPPPPPPQSYPSASSQIPARGILNVGSQGFPVVETVSAYEVRQQKELELRTNDEFWTSKLKDLESRYIAAAFAAEGEFNKELEKLDKLVPKPKEPVCQDHTIKVAACYQENSKQALKCSDVVREFALCVERSSQKPSAAG